jgi:hypothetical protein
VSKNRGYSITSIRLVALLEYLPEILSEKRQFGEHSPGRILGCGVRRPRRARGSVGSKADNASYHSHRKDHRANVTRLVAKALSGVDAPAAAGRGRAAMSRVLAATRSRDMLPDPDCSFAELPFENRPSQPCDGCR